MRDYSSYLYLALLFPSSIIVGLVAGYYIDRWLDSDPWAKLIGLGFGIFAGGYNFYLEYKRLTRKKNDTTRQS